MNNSKLLLLFLYVFVCSVSFADTNNYIHEIQELSKKLKKGEITQAEYENQKSQIRSIYLKSNSKKEKQIKETDSQINSNSIDKHQNEVLNLKSVNKSILEATVKIEVYNKTGSKVSTGSGFIVDSNGIIVTNNHVIENAASIMITLNNGDTYSDVVVRDFDEVKDIAVIKISGYDLPTVKLGNSRNLEIGEKIIVCGSSLGDLSNTLSEGIISSIRQSDKGYRYIQMSAPISPGNSGGPVVLENGEVIGISTASRIQGQNLNFAVPINYVLGMIENNKNMTLAKYSAICGQTMEHMIINDKQNSEQFAHPDTDISKRIVIVPFSGFCSFLPNIGTEIVAAFVLRLKANYKTEDLFVVDYETVANNLKSTMGDQYDSLLKTFDQEKAKEFAVKFRANTVIFGKVNHFEIDTSPVFVPFVGWVPANTAIMNIDYNVYKLDQDKIILSKNIRRKQGDLPGHEAVIRIANIAVGEMLKKWKTFASSNKNGNKPIMIKIDNNGKASVVLK